MHTSLFTKKMAAQTKELFTKFIGISYIADKKTECFC